MAEYVNQLARLAQVAAQLSPAELEDAKARKAKEDAIDAAYEAKLRRRIDRVKKWAMKQSRDDIEDHLSLAVVWIIEKRLTEKFKEDTLEHERTAHAWEVKVHRDVAKDFAWKHFKATDARKRGAAAKLANDSKQIDKVKARELFEDWQAGRTIHASGAAFARHVVTSTSIEDTNTVQRWMRQWRKGK